MLKLGLKAGGHHAFVSVLEVKRSKIFQNEIKALSLFSFLVLFFMLFLTQRLICALTMF